MKEERQTRENILDAAKKEFTLKGYPKASLRSICKQAGVTTGALYFFFQDKEDVFTALVEQPLNGLYAIMKQHYQEEEREPKKQEHSHSDDMQAGWKILQYLYQYREEFKLILSKSQGTRYENCLDRFIEITEQHMRKYADKITQEMKINKVDDFIIHWFAHLQVETFAQFLKHDIPKEKAEEQIKIMVRFMTKGWDAVFLNDS